MDTDTYQQQVRARHAELEAQQAALAHRAMRRRRLAERARARSADRWADDAARTDQQRRAGRLTLVAS